ncbi:MAG: immunoglobulin domain-containing protein [Acidobacteriota bacterium]|nr:immunoglobulin domain-containing protein [Acidobacteriota bacterium]
MYPSAGYRIVLLFISSVWAWSVTAGGLGPSISVQPADVSLCEGFDATFFVSASGGNLTYLWRKDGQPIDGATNALLLVRDVDASDEGTYDCVVTNEHGSLTSDGAVFGLTGDSLAVTQEPQGVFTCPGALVQFAVTASGTGVPAYQWRKDNVPIDGAVTDTLSIVASESNEGAFFDCVVSNVCGQVTSLPAVIDLQVPPYFAEQPQDIQACVGQSVSFSATPSGSGPFTFQWRKGNQELTGETNSTLNLIDLTEEDFGAYNCVVTNVCGTIVSEDAILETTVLGFIQEPSNATVCEGEEVTFTVEPNGVGPFAYQWKHGENEIFGAVSANLTLSNILPQEAGSYSCKVTSACGTITSGAGVLTVRNKPVITVQPVFDTACAGGITRASVTAVGEAPLLYQWRKNGVDLTGVTVSTLIRSNLSAADEGFYECVVTNACGSTTSASVRLELGGPPTILLQPVDVFPCETEDVEFSVAASGAEELSFQWRRNGVDLDGETSSTLNIVGVSSGDVGNYTCAVSSACDAVVSLPALLSLALDCESKTPDPALRNAMATGRWQNDLGDLIWIDADADGQVSTVEARAVTGILDLSGKGITDLTGIGAFVNLSGLDVSNNRLFQWPDLSQLIYLELLDLSGNLIPGGPDSRGFSSDLAVTLEELYLDRNRLKSLPDFTGLDALHTLTLSHNLLQSIQPLLDTNDIGSSPDDQVFIDNNLLAGTDDVDVRNCAEIQAMLNRTNASGASFGFDPQHRFNLLPGWPQSNDVRDLQTRLSIEMECEPALRKTKDR